MNKINMGQPSSDVGSIKTSTIKLVMRIGVVLGVGEDETNSLVSRYWLTVSRYWLTVFSQFGSSILL